MAPNLCHHRWTVDTPEGFDLISRILGALYLHNADFNMDDVLLGQHPAWPRINAFVQQKTVTPSIGSS